MDATNNISVPQIHSDPEADGPRLFTAKAIAVGTFIGGPIATTILVSQNFGKLGLTRKRNQAYLLGFGISLSYFWMISVIPAKIADSIPNVAYTGIISLIAYILTENLQGKILKEHFAKLGRKASKWAVAGWSLLAMVITLALMLLYLPMIPPFDFEEDAYTEGLLGNEIYHSDSIDEMTIKRLGSYLLETEYFDSEYSVPIQIIEDGPGYHLTFPCMRSVWSDEEMMMTFRDYGKELELNVLHRPVTVSLVDADFSRTYRKAL